MFQQVFMYMNLNNSIIFRLIKCSITFYI